MLHPAYIPPSDKRNDRTFLRTLNITGSGINMAANSFFLFSNQQENFTCAYNITPLVYKVYICMYVLTYVRICVRV